VAPTAWRIATGQFEQLLFHVSLDLDLVRPRWLGPVVKSRFESLRHEALPHALNRPQADAQSRDGLGIGTRLALQLVRQEQNAGMGQFPCS
jgi:hypothetical protein